MNCSCAAPLPCRTCEECLECGYLIADQRGGGVENLKSTTREERDAWIVSIEFAQFLEPDKTLPHVAVILRRLIAQVNELESRVEKQAKQLRETPVTDLFRRLI